MRGRIEISVPIPVSFDRKVVTDIKLLEIWKYIHKKFFYRKILGYPGNIESALEKKEPKAMELEADVERIKSAVSRYRLMRPKILYQFFRCRSDRDSIIIENGNKKLTIDFPRQQKEPYLCLSDYIDVSDDSIAFFVVTSGREILENAKKWEDQGRFKDAFILQSLAIATAEALAEYVHEKIRDDWNISRSDDTINPVRYQGRRYSFGYPACPDMSDQKKIWELLNPEEIGVTLTESYMMVPEASVSGIVFHHPEAKYFSV